MRNFIILALVAAAVTIAAPTQAVAQSGSRGVAGASRGGGVTGVSRGGGVTGVSRGGGVTGASRGGGGRSIGFSGGARRPSAAQRRQQFQQSLVQLGLPKNSSDNSKQYGLAFQEANRDFQALRSNQIAPNQLGALQLPFRLTNEDINRNSHTANWPSALRSDSFESLVQNLDQTIMDGGINSTESALDFLNELQVLNVALNTAAVQGDVNATDFAQARRFISGLANEVRSSGLIS